MYQSEDIPWAVKISLRDRISTTPATPDGTLVRLTFASKIIPAYRRYLPADRTVDFQPGEEWEEEAIECAEWGLTPEMGCIIRLRAKKGRRRWVGCPDGETIRLTNKQYLQLSEGNQFYFQRYFEYIFYLAWIKRTNGPALNEKLMSRPAIQKLHRQREEARQAREAAFISSPRVPTRLEKEVDEAFMETWKEMGFGD